MSEDPDRKQRWNSKYPTIIGALLATFQMFLTVVIVGCEIGGDFIRFNQMNVFVGYWTFPLFICACISLAGASCFCGITALVFQILAIPMALCVIVFDAYFLNEGEGGIIPPSNQALRLSPYGQPYTVPEATIPTYNTSSSQLPDRSVVVARNVQLICPQCNLRFDVTIPQT